MSVTFKTGMLFGKYRLERPLGRGGMASVWLARHTLLETPFAVKILDPSVAEKDPRYVERFMREARLASRIHHPHLVGVYDVGKEPTTGLYYLVMEYVPGGNVAQLLAKEGPLAEQTALDIVRQVAEALGQAERFGMVHRDIKPDNIMFDDQGEAKLSDLGIAKADLGDDPNLTQTAAVFGTPAYMSPEQATDAGKVDVRADIYSLGVVCYEMLAGRRPYGGKSITEILAKVVDKTPPPDVRSVRPDVSPQTAVLVRTMMDKECDRRPASPRELLEQLKKLTTTPPPIPACGTGRTMPTMDAISQVTLPTQAAATVASPIPTVTPPTDIPSTTFRKRRKLAMVLIGMAICLGILLIGFSLLQKTPTSVPHRNIDTKQISQTTPPPPSPKTVSEPSRMQQSASPTKKVTIPQSPKVKPEKSTDSASKETAADSNLPPPREYVPESVPKPSVTGHSENNKEGSRQGLVLVRTEPKNDLPQKGNSPSQTESTTPVKGMSRKGAPSIDAGEDNTRKADTPETPATPLHVTLHLLLGTREITHAEVMVVVDGRPLHFTKGPYVFETLPGKQFEVSVARGDDGKERWKAITAHQMTAEENPHITLPMCAETVEPKRIQGLSIIENGKAVTTIQGHFRKFGGKAQAFGPYTPEELADFLRRNAPRNGNYWLFLKRSDGSEASFCPAKMPRRAGDIQPHHAGMRLDLTTESAELYETPSLRD